MSDEHFTDLCELSKCEPNPFLSFSFSVPMVSICHAGGTIPKRRWSSSAEIWDSMRIELLETIGLGSVLTFGNPNGRELVQYGEMAIQDCELWGARVYPITVFYYGVSRLWHDAVAHDRRFHMSWSERTSLNFLYFTACASAYDWWKFLKHKDDPGFKKIQRHMMKQTWDIFSLLLPSLFERSPNDSSETLTARQGPSLNTETEQGVQR